MDKIYRYRMCSLMPQFKNINFINNFAYALLHCRRHFTASSTEHFLILNFEFITMIFAISFMVTNQIIFYYIILIMYTRLTTIH